MSVVEKETGFLYRIPHLERDESLHSINNCPVSNGGIFSLSIFRTLANKNQALYWVVIDVMIRSIIEGWVWSPVLSTLISHSQYDNDQKQWFECSNLSMLGTLLRRVKRACNNFHLSFHSQDGKQIFNLWVTMSQWHNIHQSRTMELEYKVSKNQRFLMLRYNYSLPHSKNKSVFYPIPVPSYGQLVISMVPSVLFRPWEYKTPGDPTQGFESWYLGEWIISRSPFRIDLSPRLVEKVAADRADCPMKMYPSPILIEWTAADRPDCSMIHHDYQRFVL